MLSIETYLEYTLFALESIKLTESLREGPLRFKLINMLRTIINKATIIKDFLEYDYNNIQSNAVGIHRRSKAS